MVKIKSVVIAVCVMSSLPLCAMEIATYNKKSYKKLNDYSLVKNALFFAKNMYERGDITKDVAGSIVHTTCLLRMDEIYKNFDSFFHFYHDSYNKMILDHNLNKLLFIGANPDFDGNNEAFIEKFNKLYPCNLNLCRKFDFLEPHHLVFFTEKQDKILLSLVNRPECFYTFLDTCSLHMTIKENESFLMLPPELIELLKLYPKFVTYPSRKRRFSDEDSDFYMDVILK
jgi:hypothetical protein